MWRINTLNFLLAVAVLGSSLALVACADPVFGLKDTYSGESFFQGFEFLTLDDPTHGRVNYVSQHDAIEKNLSYVSDGKFIMRADNTKVVPPTARGRDSIRIVSYASYSDSIIVLDLNHMPEGCSTWPAFWTLSATGPWPHGGEIDIIEGRDFLHHAHAINLTVVYNIGVNRDTRNLASLHTTPGCNMTGVRFMSGESASTDCDTQVNFNQGCGVNFNKPNSYGSTLNSAGGGWYVMRRTVEDGISIWFWPRYDVTVPDAVRYQEPTLKPDIFWGYPEARFPFTPSCDASHFNAHQIIFDLTFCGDFAGARYPTSGCPGNCVDLVNNEPTAFSLAYWDINALRVYTRL